nr:hypothetical protein [uncultured Mediterranean phage uvMED]BAR20182.1 hypothetical protein [uncultured Mediterranean phage uvMED]BAR38359.1 hypothetical protein [uncultured Mediterranean phage uvMED]
MAHFAELDSNNIVIEVKKACNIDIQNNGGEQSEQSAKHFESVCPLSENGVKYVQTSYNDNFRKQYAGIGYFYDSTKDKFISPQPYPSWSLDSNDDWQPPLTHPTITHDYADPVVWIWSMSWNETAYNNDNTKGWKGKKLNIDRTTHVDTAIYDWNGTDWVTE